MKKYPTIYGFNGSSEAGQDSFAPAIFLGGCNFRCDYCMNATLVMDYGAIREAISLDCIRDFVKENDCESVNVSGGEVTIHPTDQLINLFEEIRSWGCKVSISTNGFLTSKLMDIIPYVNYVTMDIKTGVDKYNQIVHIKALSAWHDVINSLDLLQIHKSNDFNYEIRTTLYRPLVGESEIREIGSELNKNEEWTLQPFRKAKNMIGEKAYLVDPYSEGEMESLLNIAKEYTDKASLRYV